jgi:transcriptional regulator with XRE-family HTH domain
MSDNLQKEVFRKNLNFYFQLNKKSQKEVADLLGIGLSTFNSWCTGTKMPRMDKVQKLADYFNITKSDLIENNLEIASKHSEDYKHITNLCNIGFKSVMTWAEDSFYKEYETIALRDHFSNFLYQYKDILETLNGAKRYWLNSQEEIIGFYRKRDANLSEKQIKELFFKQELDDKLELTAKLISNMSTYITNIEDKYENNTNLSPQEKIKFFTLSAHKNKD